MTWTDAAPRSLGQMRNHATRYEVEGRAGDDRIRVGFLQRQTRRALIRLIQSRAAEIVERTGVSEDVKVSFGRDAAGRWWARLHGTPWTIGFTGRTERDVRTSNPR